MVFEVLGALMQLVPYVSAFLNNAKKVSAVFKFLRWGWRDGAEVQGIDCCSSRGPEFDSQHPHGG